MQFLVVLIDVRTVKTNFKNPRFFDFQVRILLFLVKTR